MLDQGAVLGAGGIVAGGQDGGEAVGRHFFQLFVRVILDQRQQPDGEEIIQIGLAIVVLEFGIGQGNPAQRQDLRHPQPFANAFQFGDLGPHIGGAPIDRLKVQLEQAVGYDALKGVFDCICELEAKLALDNESAARSSSSGLKKMG